MDINFFKKKIKECIYLKKTIIILGRGFSTTLFLENKNKNKNKYLIIGFNTDEIINEVDFYFTHSYRMQCMDASIISGTSWHGEAFVSAVEHENIMGTQFHL